MMCYVTVPAILKSSLAERFSSKTKSLQSHLAHRAARITDSMPLKLQDHGHRASVPVYSPAYVGTKLYCLVTGTWVKNVPKFALDRAAVRMEPTVSS